jgi:hypothetical protein
VVDAMGIVRILNTNAHPNIIVPGKFPREFHQSLGSLGQNLKYVPISFSHDIKDVANEFQRNVRMKKIAHRIDEDFP